MSAEDDQKWKPAEDISGESRATIKFPTVADKARWYKLLENVQKSIPGDKTKTYGNAAVMIVSMAEQRYEQLGYGNGQPQNTQIEYQLFEAITQTLLRRIHDLLEGYASGMDAMRENGDKQVRELEEKLAGTKNDLNNEIDERDERINELLKGNADLVEANQLLKNDNENLLSLKQSNEKNVQALEKEIESLQEKISELRRVSEENAELLKLKREHEEKIIDLGKELTEFNHQHQIQIKEAQIDFQKKLSKAVEDATASSEQKIRQDFDSLISNLKSQLVEYKERDAARIDQMKTERIEAQELIRVARAEERAKAEKDNAWLHEILQEVIKERMPAGVERELTSVTGSAAERTT